MTIQSTNTPVVVIIESLNDYHAMKDDLANTRNLIKELGEEELHLLKENGPSTSTVKIMKKIGLLTEREEATTASMAAYLSSARKKVLVASSVLAIAVTAGIVFLVKR